MKITVDNYRFKKEFEDNGRDDKFTDDALDVLFDWYEEIDPDMELDVVAVACEWTEYDAEELADEYSHLLDEDEDEEYESQEDRMEAIVEALEDETTVIKVDIDSYLVMAF
ncbi:hypothetical protein AGMMS49992_30550 [Clostridia bacterium]|nr:hypothetical protein AGMMS49992_30550 [Clostridia bacterium]